jgi:hypothetical protein
MTYFIKHKKETLKKGLESYHVSIHHIKQALRTIHGMGITHQKLRTQPPHLIPCIHLTGKPET